MTVKDANCSFQFNPIAAGGTLGNASVQLLITDGLTYCLWMFVDATSNKNLSNALSLICRYKANDLLVKINYKYIIHDQK